jgi:hypothetical protein
VLLAGAAILIAAARTAWSGDNAEPVVPVTATRKWPIYSIGGFREAHLVAAAVF